MRPPRRFDPDRTERYNRNRRHLIKNRSSRGRNMRFRIETLESRHLLAAQPLITEFLAKNDGLVDDGDGNTPDFIEIQNTGSEAIDLLGYRLTDDPTTLNKWTFPSINLDAGAFLVVYASGQDSASYVDAGGNLHTNFSLSRKGEFLALVDPDNSIISRFGSADLDYPKQLSNVSYGRAQSVTLISPDSPAQYTFPAGEIENWQSPEFDATAAGFLDGTAALGLETSTSSRNTYIGSFDTELPESTVSVYTRLSFDLADSMAISNLKLRMKYDDGFVAYLNGTKVAWDNAPDVLQWFSIATAKTRDSNSLAWVEFDLTEHVEQLRRGTNVLALHGLNHLTDRSDMLLVAELTAGASDLEAVTGTPPPKLGT